jgi:integrase
VDLPRDDRREERRFLDAHQIQRLADAIDRQHANLIYMAAYTGARWAELAGLRIERVNLLRATLEISETLAEMNGRLITQGTKTGARCLVSSLR